MQDSNRSCELHSIFYYNLQFVSSMASSGETSRNNKSDRLGKGRQNYEQQIYKDNSLSCASSFLGKNGISHNYYTGAKNHSSGKE